MDINYFLSTKKKLQRILAYLHEIKMTYYEIQMEKNDCLNCEYIEEQVNEYMKKINEHDLIIEQLNELIYSNCQHEFVEDIIDLSTDRSKQITYCRICEYTKEYGFNK